MNLSTKFIQTGNLHHGNVKFQRIECFLKFLKLIASFETNFEVKVNDKKTPVKGELMISSFTSKFLLEPTNIRL